MRFVLGLWLCSQTLFAQSESVQLDPQKTRYSWEGWGTSLAWWGVGAGASPFEALLSDAVFTLKTVSIKGTDVQGLGLNIVRYNIGGWTDR